MKIGYVSFSLPFRWWYNTTIAHNRIFAHTLMEFSKRGHEQFILNERPDPNTGGYIREFKASITPAWLTDRTVSELDALIVFCGPYLPIADFDSKIAKTLHVLRIFEGRVVFVTCDYLLQLETKIRRYGLLFHTWPEDCLTKNKDFKYILHGDFEHHFRTKKQVEDALKITDRQNFLEVPLNKSGIPPKWYSINRSEKPEIDLLYCGAFRRGRVTLFEKYFCTRYAENWFVSTSQETKFRKLPGIKANVRNVFPSYIWKFLNKCWAQLIICDRADVKLKKNPLPTRYWEALASKSVPIFDKGMRPSFEYNKEFLSEPLVVDGPRELSEMIDLLKNDIGFRNNVLAENDLLIEKFDPYKEWRMREWLH